MTGAAARTIGVFSSLISPLVVQGDAVYHLTFLGYLIGRCVESRPYIARNM
ncbi:hypothetical protein LR021_06285 [Candidatus Bipolaricaulota bacterium]|nr:hypothetical protein [Candidatus Bipolaricaulota bacterium]